MGLSNKKKSGKAAPASKKVGLSKAEREAKLLAAAASKAEKENTNPAPQEAKKTLKVSTYHAVYRKWVLEQDPRCELIDENNLKCKACETNIGLETVYCFYTWFKHAKQKVHQKGEKEWAKKSNVEIASLRTKAPKIIDFLLETYAVEKVAEPPLTDEDVEAWIDEREPIPSVLPDPLPRKCRCASAPGGFGTSSYLRPTTHPFKEVQDPTSQLPNYDI
ncbi:hypothetical protein DFP72DRAFT_851226 [Ephemerocybe angulata]|uniref:Uncharacterized protein n=1 Tax=Ephemerocybe angulata TaxID=980116 RepID=A0A8H6HQR4_9AGAR|nr:hypothetical protein DFP72DRAFT_851226 [Tulosesus angulatus]